MHAMTFHKCQDSPAHEVSVLLPQIDSRLHNRELLHSAVTRFTTKVRVVGTAGLSRRLQDCE